MMSALKSVRDKRNNNIGKIVSFPILRFLALFCERSDEEEITRPRRDDFFTQFRRRQRRRISLKFFP